MKKYILLFAVVLLAAVSNGQATTAQPAAKKEIKSPNERAARRTKTMTEKYQLNESQNQRLLEVNRQNAQDHESFRKQEELDKAQRKARRTQRKATHDRYMEQVKSIMTPEQFAAFEKDLNARKAQRKEARKARKAKGQD